MKLLRLLLFPFSLLYAAIMWLRNRGYDSGILPSKTFELPVIVVGNLAVGGTGKSPMTEFLIRLLQPKYRLATLSRGYGRKTKGFRAVELTASADEVGDEPLQFKHKFPNLSVYVGEDRCASIARIQDSYEVILLDDAYQHRRLKPSMSILLFDYRSCLSPMLPLPTGNFRDNLGESKRADIIVITKTPASASQAEKARILQRLQRANASALYAFASIRYGALVYPHLADPQAAAAQQDLSQCSVLLLTGIANPQPLLDYLSPAVAAIEQLRYADHYNYSLADIQQIKQRFEAIPATEKLIITTEKDFQRLDTPAFRAALAPYTIQYIPIEIGLDATDQAKIEKMLLTHCMALRGH